MLAALDWLIVVAFFAVTLGIGMAASRRAGSSSVEYFLSGRHMPWWLLGVSMVATTFSADTPNLVTDIVRQNGVAGNWVWWAFLLTGMLTVFVYARLWRRSKVLTDLEFYEIRYSGRAAAFLRGFRALYLGVFFNVLIMATVSLAMIKIAGVMLGYSPVKTLIIASVITAAYSAAGGLRAVVLTDFLQFGLAMAGAIGAAVVAVRMPQVGGLTHLLQHPALAGKTSFLPDFSDTSMVISLLVIPLAVQWWSVWYPGAEPGGGGYIAQRMLSARDEDGAVHVSYRLAGALTPEVEERIQSGIPVTFRHRIEISTGRWMPLVPDRVVSRTLMETRVRYDSLTRNYELFRKIEQKARGGSQADLTAALATEVAAMQTLRDLLTSDGQPVPPEVAAFSDLPAGDEKMVGGWDAVRAVIANLQPGLRTLIHSFQTSSKNSCAFSMLSREYNSPHIFSLPGYGGEVITMSMLLSSILFRDSTTSPRIIIVYGIISFAFIVNRGFLSTMETLLLLKIA